MRLVDRAPVRSDFLTGLLRERDLQAKALSLAGPVFTGPNLLAHVPLQRGLLPKEPSVHVSVAVYLGPGGPAVTGKDWAKSLSLSLSLSPFVAVCLKMIGLGGMTKIGHICSWRHQGHPDANYKKQLCLKMIGLGRVTRIGEYGPGGTKATLMQITRSSCVLK